MEKEIGIRVLTSYFTTSQDVWVYFYQAINNCSHFLPRTFYKYAWPLASTNKQVAAEKSVTASKA